MATETKRPKRPANLSSHTELSTLTQCERRWWYNYVQKIRGEASPQMILGSTMGVCCDAFWLGEDWRLALATLITVAEAQAGGYEASPATDINLDLVEAEPYATAYWLMCRYERHYEHMVGKVKVIAQELDCRATIPGTKFKHQAIIDEVWEIDGRNWMVERKTYGKTDKLAMVDVDPQLTNNLWVAREHTGLKFAGIIFDGIYTYHWKAEKPTQQQLIDEAIALSWSSNGGPFWAEGSHMGDGYKIADLTKTAQRDWARAQLEVHPGLDRPDSESFEMIYLDRTEKHIKQAQVEIVGQLKRRAQLRRGVHPNRNLGPFCTNCPARSQCFEDLAFPQDVEVDFS